MTHPSQESEMPVAEAPFSEADLDGLRAYHGVDHHSRFCAEGGPGLCRVQRWLATLDAAREQAATEARRELLATLRTDIEAKRLTPSDFTTRWGHGYSDAIRSVLFLIDGRLIKEPQR